jgi:hypothetical protein
VLRQPILLQILLRQRQWHRYGIFRAAYDDAAKQVDRDLIGTAPSRAQLHRWTSGVLKRLPYTNHCRVLESMFPGWTADQLFAPCPDDVLSGKRPGLRPAVLRHLPAGGTRHDDAPLADVTAVFATRAEFTYAMPPHAIFDNAKEIKVAGLSLNLICQQYPDQGLHRLIENGTELHCLFLDPDGDAIKRREREEGYTDHPLVMLTKLNIEVLSRLRDRLSPCARERLSLAVYDETIRFSIVLIDGETCALQPYLPQARGVDSPTFVVQKSLENPGLYSTFEQVYTELWGRSRPV